MDDSGQDEYVRGKAQWRVGIAALRRVRHLVDDDDKDEQFKRVVARYVTAGFVLVLILLLVTAGFAPETIQNLLRSLS
jgi:hypothetical protein